MATAELQPSKAAHVVRLHFSPVDDICKVFEQTFLSLRGLGLRTNLEQSGVIGYFLNEYGRDPLRRRIPLCSGGWSFGIEFVHRENLAGFYLGGTDRQGTAYSFALFENDTRELEGEVRANDQDLAMRIAEKTAEICDTYAS